MTSKVQDASGVDAPLEDRCIIVVIDGLAHGVVDGSALENALNDLQDEANNSGRAIVSRVVHATSRGVFGIIYTIQAQWIGLETLKKTQRMQALSQQVPGERTRLV